jgi:transcriptional regulator of met regulon
MYNVMYDLPNGKTRLYLLNHTTLPEAHKYCEVFRTKYVGQPFPNARGVYEFTNPRVVRVFGGR